MKITAVGGLLDANTVNVPSSGLPLKYTGPNTITNTRTGGAVVLSAGTLSTDSAGLDGTHLTITQNANGGVSVRTSGTGNVTVPTIVNT